MDLTAPININDVIGAVKDHQAELVALDTLDAAEVLQYATPIPGVHDSYTLHRVTNGKVSAMYNGVFIGRTEAGKIVPRTLTVRPVKIEEKDEPERYRRSWIADVKGGLWPQDHPFALWLVQHVINLASNDLREVLFTASYDAAQISASANADIKYAFDGWGAIVTAEKTAGNITVAKGNMYNTGTLTAANIGDKLLAMYRSMPETFRAKKDAQIFLSLDLFDLYNDWYESKYTFVAGVGDDESHPVFLRGTQKKVKLCPVPMPAGSQLVILTTKANTVYGYDKEEDLKNVQPFNSGNPYEFSMAGKYVFGTQFASIDKSEFLVNEAPLTPATSAEP